MKQYKPIQHPIINVLVFLFFILFMFPFGMVVLNSAKTSKEIIYEILGEKDSEFFERSTVIKIAILYSVAYLYEHREEANHKELTLTLRALLFGARKADF